MTRWPSTEPNARWDAGGVASRPRARPAASSRSAAPSSSSPTPTCADVIVVVARTRESSSAGRRRQPVPGAEGHSRARRSRCCRRWIRRASCARSKLDDVRGAGADGLLGAARRRRGRRWRACSTAPPWRSAPRCAAAPSACSTMTTEYAKIRVAFGKPIGSYQGSSTARPTCWSSRERQVADRTTRAWAVDDERARRRCAASMAKAYASDAYRQGRRRRHPGARRHRLHLGARPASLLQARQVVGVHVRRRELPPATRRPADQPVALSIFSEGHGSPCPSSSPDRDRGFP
mgnify:CR=1 FL=1